MKRILAIFLLIFAIVISSLSVTSCDASVDSGNNGGDSGNGIIDEEQGGSNNSGENDSGSNDDDTGSGNEGSGNTGGDNTGSGNEGSGNTGGDNTGSGDEGSGSTGEDNTGSGDEGSGNTGGDNTGSGNEGSGNTGGDNTGSGDEGSSCVHTDADNNNECDLCFESLLVVIDFYVVNDLHGKFCDTASQPGVDELSTYLKSMYNIDDNVVILSSGDMWQGTAESGLTGGLIITEWMNELDFVSMTLGNHEYDWGEDIIRENLEIAEFPFLAINIYNKSTGKLADYCTPSIMIERDGIQIGIIGAIGDCYSSISSDMVSGVEFKVGSELTALVKAESERLRSQGADLIVYSLHDGYGTSNYTDSAISSSDLSSYYDTVLSNGYVDICFEAHTHMKYVYYDAYSVYHVQGKGENAGISHVEMSVNILTGAKTLNEAEVVASSVYSQYEDDPATEAIEEKYSNTISKAYEVLGNVSTEQSSSAVADIVSELYLEVGLERWGDQYDIVLGGGFIKTRSPYDLAAGKDVMYADVYSLLTFNNSIVLCKVSGSKLLSQFVNTTNSNYHNTYSEYGSSIKESISSSATYYVVVDTYTAYFSYNGLTIVDWYDEGVYARDLLAEEIKSGRFDNSSEDDDTPSVESSASNPVTDISVIIGIGNTLAAGEQTLDKYYVKGKIVSIHHSTYGNLTIEDENGNQIYVYGLYDQYGNRYDSMSVKPVAGDTIIVYAPILNYQGNGYTKLELLNATLIQIL